MPENSQYNPVVSIFTLTFNQEAYVGQCIESVLAQEYTNWEMIILDDGSTDNTWGIIQGYTIRDGRIKSQRRDNKGIFAMAEAYNLMLSQSSGELIAILDGDDLWPSNKLSTQTVFHFNQGFDFTFGVCVTIEANTLKLSGIIPSKGDRSRIGLIEAKGGLSNEYLRGSFPISAVTCMIHRSYLIKINGFTQPIYLPTTDYPTWVNVLATDCKAHFIDLELGFWRIQAGQTTWKRAREMALGMLRYSQEFAGETNETAVMSTGRQNFISDSLYRHALYNLNQRNFNEVRIALSGLVKFKGYRYIFKFVAALCIRIARSTWLSMFKLKISA